MNSLETMLAILLILMTIFHESMSKSQVWPEKSKIFTKKGYKTELVCSSNHKKKYCAFSPPVGGTVTMNNEWDCEERFCAFKTDSSNSEKQCAMRIDKTLEKDKG